MEDLDQKISKTECVLTDTNVFGMKDGGCLESTGVFEKLLLPERTFLCDSGLTFYPIKINEKRIERKMTPQSELPRAAIRE
jgi:hypothetical protein